MSSCLQTGRMKRSLPSCLALTVALLGCSFVSSNPTLCELASSRGAFADQTVTVEGTLLVSKHGSTVEDASCDNGIPISWRDNSPALREIAEIAERGVVERHTIKVRMTGKMKLVQGSASRNKPYWQLQVTSGQLLQ
jgi:hypothetical protein